MGPKKRQHDIVQRNSKRVRTATIPNPTVPQVDPPQVDYDKLAAAILKQTNSLPLPAAGQSTSTSSGQSQSINTLPQPMVSCQISSSVNPQPASTLPQPALQSVPSRSTVSTSQTTTLSGIMDPTTQDSVAEPSGNSQVATGAPGLGSLIDQIFLGEPAKSTVNFDSESLNEGIPLGASVSQKIKSKIWSNEFIDLRAVLTFKEDPLSVTISSGVINLNQDSKFKNPISIGQWTDAFLVFSAIYLEKNPNDAPHLLKYCHTVRELQRLYGDVAFRSYDERFRKLRESRNVPWQKPIAELMLKAATTPKPFPPKSQPQPFRVKYCFAFNRGERCKRNPCRYKHACSQCRANHPKSKCTNPPNKNATHRPTYSGQSQ